MFAIRSGNFQLSLMLATALAVSVWPAAGHAYPQQIHSMSTGPVFGIRSQPQGLAAHLFTATEKPSLG
jgi:hypothetical protein